VIFNPAIATVPAFHVVLLSRTRKFAPILVTKSFALMVDFSKICLVSRKIVFKLRKDYYEGRTSAT
jgi:hypothetical protein